jgi:hypothetical protein
MVELEDLDPSGGANHEYQVPLMPQDEACLVTTDLLIIGAGPAGASLACFLAQHGNPPRQPSGPEDILTLPVRSQRHHTCINT